MLILTARTIPTLSTGYLKQLLEINILVGCDNPEHHAFRSVQIFGGFVWGNGIFQEMLKEARRTFQAPQALDTVQQDRLNRGEMGAVYREIGLDLLKNLVGLLRRDGEVELAELLWIAGDDGRQRVW